jgi:hypothetical protein
VEKHEDNDEKVWGKMHWGKKGKKCNYENKEKKKIEQKKFYKRKMMMIKGIVSRVFF